MSETQETSLGKFKVRYRTKASRKFKTFQGEVFSPKNHADRNILMILDPANVDPAELKEGETLETPIYRTLAIANCLTVKAQ